MNVKSIIWIFIIAISWTAGNVFSQNSGIPSGISYQAVAHDAHGFELTNTNITVRISLIKGTSDGIAEWIETHSITTDQFGLFNLIIGEGTRESESIADKFSDLHWGTDRYYLKVEIDFGSGYRNLGIMPFLSVPYALYAATSGNSISSDNQSLHFDSISHILSIQRGDSVDLSSLIRNDYSKAFITKIELHGDTLSIIQADQVQSVNLSGLNQHISFDTINNRLTLSNGGSVNLSGFVKNSETNRFYISSMILSGDSLVIFQGGVRKTIDLSHFNNQPNPYQHLSLTNNSLKLSQDTTSIDLSKYLDNSNQSLSLIGDNLKLTNDTGSVNLAKYNKFLSLVGNALFLTNTPNYAPVDFSQFQYRMQWDSVKNLYSLKDGSGYSKGDPIIIPPPYIQDLRILDDKLWITGNAEATVIDLRKYVQQITLMQDSNKVYVKNGYGVTSFTVNQSLSLDDSILSLTKDPTNKKINLNAFDNQKLYVNAPNKLTIDNGNTVSIDTDPLNEIQNLVLKNDTLSLTKDTTKTKVALVSYDRQKLHLSNNKLSIDRGDTVDLGIYLDNTDAQQLSFSNGQLNLTNSTSVNVRETLYAFRAVNNSGSTIISANDSVKIIFTNELMDNSNLYDKNSGIFTCPADGLYQFNVSYDYPVSSNIQLRVIKNGSILETLQKFNNYSFIYFLNVTDTLYIRLVNSNSVVVMGICSFMGYRINQ